jgi:hypothetical protein
MSLMFHGASLVLRTWASPLRRKFEESLENPEMAQAQVLSRIKKISKYPWPGSWTRWPDWIDKPRPTLQRTLFFESTSGSGSAKKEIPYNRALLGCFQRMFLLWADDLLRHSPRALNTGKIFMSISPQLGNSGLRDDTAYLGQLLGPLLSSFLAVDPRLQKQHQSDEFLFAVATSLLDCPDLEVCSIWSPSYFLALLNVISENRTSFAASSTRSQVRELLQETKIPWDQVWPELKIISCWDSAMARRGAKQLGEIFPQVLVQGKGLLATEAPMTIPLSSTPYPIPLVNEIYFEFLDSNEELISWSSLREGEVYELAISTPGGLLRYRIGDRVRVMGFYKKTPLLIFEGRAGGVCDLVGEKLDASFVQSVLDPIISGLYVLLPKENGYELLVEPGESKKLLAAEDSLQSSHHYRLARDLKQLRGLEIMEIVDLEPHWIRSHESIGIRSGDFKWTALVSDPTRATQLRTALKMRSKISTTSEPRSVPKSHGP